MFFFRISLEKQTEKQIGAIKSLKPANRKDKFNKNGSTFKRNLMNDLIRDKLKEVISLKDII